MASLPDIVLLTIDALRADHLSYHGYERETPTLDTLVEEGVPAPTTISVSLHARESMPARLTREYSDMTVNTCDVRTRWEREKTPENNRVTQLLSRPGYAK